MPGAMMSIEEARQYHAPQIEIFAQTDADMASALTLNYVDEAIGVALAAKGAGIPIAISFTVETDGRLPDGSSLADAITRTDEAAGGFVPYFMINCAHPNHFASTLMGAVTGATEWAAFARMHQRKATQS
ncbi:homocysteine S-methyltransferase family protein [Microbulbifer taiwanensis]|uniref:homocysteine S-methyltransferase family protein n=1 Tax=Microbulbifer taiwanensis TaxID=986746 RepID=UPI003610F002